MIAAANVAAVPIGPNFMPAAINMIVNAIQILPFILHDSFHIKKAVIIIMAMSTINPIKLSVNIIFYSSFYDFGVIF